MRAAKPKSNPPPKKPIVKPETREEENYIDDDDDEVNDIFAEAFQKKDDDYQEEPEDEDMDDFVVLDDEEAEEEDANPSKRGSKTSSSASKRKRKSIVSDHEEDEDEDEAPKKKRTPAKKPPAKKPPAKKQKAPPKRSNEEILENSEVQKIHNAIPTVRPPTPPPREGAQKFNFRDAVTRSAPVAQGSKVVPSGADNCLAGLAFVFTGVLESLSREDGQQLVKKYGGKVTTAPSKKTSYVVLGSEAGPKKLETIHNLKLKTINEDGLFQLIRTLPPNGGDSKAAKDWEAKRAADEKKIMDMAAEMEKQARADAKSAKANGTASRDAHQLWTSKYAPTKMTEICGNKGNVEKLQRWLQNWPKNHKTQFKMRRADGFGVYRAVMIHGPPGIGKTTAAHLVANLEGYDVLEYNASDTRSKKLMEETMRGALDNKSLMGYFAPGQEKAAQSKKKLLIVMDEVDGMSAGDRGGVGQLAAFCKKTNVGLLHRDCVDCDLQIIGSHHLYLQ